MLAYWFLITVPMCFLLMPLNQKSIHTPALWFVGLFYLLFIGCRNETGADWAAYLDMYERIRWYSFTDALEYTEISFAILNWLLGQIDAGVIVVNIIAAIFFVSGLIRFAQKMPNPWLALISVTPYLVIAIGMSAVRQSMAIGLVFHLFASWQQSLFKKISLASIATSFHYSAIVALIFVVQSIKMPSWFRYTLLVGGAVVSYPIFNATEAYSKYNQTYIVDDIVSPGAFMHALLNAIPAIIYLLFIKKWNAVFGKSDLIRILAILSIFSVFGVFVSSTGIDRLALYLSPIQMLVYSSMPYVFGRKNQSILYSLIITYHGIVLYWWLNYANTSMGWIPYKNILF